MSIQYTADQLQRKFREASSSPGFSRLAEVLRSEGRIDEAIQTCEEGLRARPDTLSGLLVLGKALLDAGRVEESREQFEAVLRLDPRCLSAMHYLARIMTEMQWPEAAAGYYRSILEVEPWDAEIRALLSGASHVATAPMSAGAHAPESGFHAAVPAPEDTFHKPDGFSGDVMEVNLNDMAADFLPGQDDDASLGLAEESLEDALAASQEPMAHQPRFEAPAPPARIAEPLPMDLLKDEPDALSGMDGDAPPISGQDVEDRLDSLFGVEDSPTAAMRDATATWSPAPAESPAPEIPPGPDFSPTDFSSAATAIGELRGAETGGMRMPVESDQAPAEPAPMESTPTEDLRPLDLASVPDLPDPYATPLDPEALEAPEAPEVDEAQDGQAADNALQATEIPGVQDFGAVDFETPLEKRFPADSAAFADQEVPGSDDRVHGEDIERRLDELFNLTEEDDLPPSGTSTLPVAPGPTVGEAVSLGEVVSFGGEIDFAEPAAEAEPGTTVSPAEASAEDTITGQDVADKLDHLFGAEIGAASDTQSDSPFGSTAAASVPAPVVKEPTPWPADDLESAQPPPSGEVMTTESMVPPGWFGEAGDGPSITGADVEAQLDKLFQIETDGEKPAGGHGTGTLAPPQAEPMPGDEADLTVMMPAMRETPKDAGSIKDSVADWLARRTQDADQGMAAERNSLADQTAGIEEMPGQDYGAGETLILPVDETVSLSDFDAAQELPPGARETSLGVFQDEDSFGTLAQEDSALLSETTSIEMVDGEDIAGRLDELFADEGSSGGATIGKTDAASVSDAEMSLFTPESGDIPDLTGAEDPQSVSGEDVSSRLEQLFEAGDVPAATGSEAASQSESGAASGLDTGEIAIESAEAASEGLAAGSETDDDMVPLTGFVKPAAPADPVASVAPAAPAAPVLAPMSDEEDAYPDEDELAAQSGAGANVATVTLAEIYFQQGLREQALQIYRQLLEREPENDSVRKRIEEIEATKPDGGEPGPGSDLRRPRPGLKVPKRKK